MAIVYSIELDCLPRNTFGGEQLRDTLSRWTMASSVREQFLKKGMANEELMIYEEKQTELDGSVDSQRVSVAQVRRACQGIEKTAHACKECPASLLGTPYSCFQPLFLPLSDMAEEWLLSRADKGDTRCSEILRQGLQEEPQKIEARFANWRKAGFLEAKRPVSKEWGEGELTSDQLLHLIFMVGEWTPNHSLGLLLGLDALETKDGRRGDAILSMIEEFQEKEDSELSPLSFTLLPKEHHDASIKELIQLLYAAYVAFSLQAPLSIHL